MNQRVNLFLVVFLSYLLAFAIFADAKNLKHKISKHKISPCCEAPGCSGWKNLIHEPTANLVLKPDVTTAQHCCQKCVENPDCFEWLFGYSLCKHVVNSFPPDICSLPTGTILPESTDAGIIRCED
ncbi:25341_t:CDS:1, partial [Gigaspora rosea]